ncbi:hypothetical protein [Paenibacillus dendritiformis]|uniref:hypothetical protein n=1 Tax=Paenibacillus dendritiformis TaxID=130049 RepID=UPI000DAAB78A|nr:hypothetical protein [Paenibacillus dendritiformis]PZM62389.1 hypothetical protein DOE73_27400 [Paenibacillus dendritiformis]
MLGIIGLMLCLMIVAGCSGNNEKPDPQHISQKFQHILEKAGVTPRYLDTTTYSGDELDIVKILNLGMRYSLENNPQGISRLYSKENADEKDNPNQNVLSIIVSLDNAQFNHVSDTEIEAFVVQSQITLYDPNYYIHSGTMIYYMIKENNEWKILSIQN